MSISWADVQAIAPELTNTKVPTATQTLLLQIVDFQLDDTAWGDLADVGRRYLAAHLGTLYANGGGTAGYVTSETLGAMSRTYALPKGLSGALATTRYGAEYDRLIQLLPCSLGFVP